MRDEDDAGPTSDTAHRDVALISNVRRPHSETRRVANYPRGHNICLTRKHHVWRRSPVEGSGTRFHRARSYPDPRQSESVSAQRFTCASVVIPRATALLCWYFEDRSLKGAGLRIIFLTIGRLSSTPDAAVLRLWPARGRRTQLVIRRAAGGFSGVWRTHDGTRTPPYARGDSPADTTARPGTQ